MRHGIRIGVAVVAAMGAVSCAEVLQAAWTPPSRDPAAVPAGSYVVEPQHTQVMFGVMHLGFTQYYGSFSGASGTLRVDPRNLETAALTVEVPVASVSTTSAKLTEELKSGDWLDAARYPTMRFVSIRVVRTGPDTADVDGTLTLHGVSRPVVLHATFNAAGVNPLSRRETLGFAAAGTIARSQFGVTKYVPLVSDDVSLILSGAFEKAP